MNRIARSTALAVFMTVVLALPAVAAPLVFPMRDQDGFPTDNDPPEVTAASWILYDQSTDTVLGEWDADTPRPMASITKIMTVLLAIEEGSMDDEVLISEEAAGQGGQEIDLVAGETVTLGALVRAAMIRSGNDAAAAIAEHIGGSVDGFVAMMNERADELGMTNTRFVNPNGLDAAGHYSTPRDMLVLGLEAMKHPEFDELARSRVMVFPDAPDGTQRMATNTNRILNTYEGAIGIKTGETPRAGLTYVGVAERHGRRLYVVVFNSVGQRAHFTDAIALYNWAFRDLSIQGLMATGSPFQPVSARVGTSPLLEAARIETFLHNAAQGVTADPPRPPGEEEAPGPPPVVEITRHPDPAPDSFLTTLSYWFGLVTGTFDG